MNKLLARVLGRRYNPATGHYDRAISVREFDFVSGVLQSHLLYPGESGGVTFLRAYWFMYLGGSTAYPWLLKHLEVGNPTAAAITFRMALMTVADGTPGTSNAFLAWDTLVPAGEVWTWQGEIPLSGRYFYAKAAAPGLTLYLGAQQATG
ncbi:MAG: hypothetical protein P8Y14_25845 [Anaerolineales bacterium]|jgi:hypothetical protein